MTNFPDYEKYKMTTDASTGLTTLEDKTEYQEIGDIFTADDINETNKAVLQNNSEIEDIKGIKKNYGSFGKLEHICALFADCWCSWSKKRT